MLGFRCVCDGSLKRAVREREPVSCDVHLVAGGSGDGAVGVVQSMEEVMDALLF
jgi:hypothetical protein